MFLLLENYGVRNLEAVFAVLISTMGLSFAWMFSDAQPSGKELLIGWNPVIFSPLYLDLIIIVTLSQFTYNGRSFGSKAQLKNN